MNRLAIKLDPEDEHWRDRVFLTGYGYLAFWQDGKNVFLHKHLMGVANDSTQQVDHEDEDKWNCKKSNLRLATRSQNSANRSKFIGSFSSKYKGVTWRTQRGHFIAGIRVNKKWIYLGSGTEEQCALMYNKAALKYFGEFAKLNEVNNETIANEATSNSDSIGVRTS